MVDVTSISCVASLETKKLFRQVRSSTENCLAEKEIDQTVAKTAKHAAKKP